MRTDKKKCHVQQHMTCAEFGLWEQYRKLSYLSGEMYEEPGNTAKRFYGVSRTTLWRLRKKLIAKGFLVCVKPSVKHGSDGRPIPAIYKVLDHKEWLTSTNETVRKAHNKYPCKECAEPVSPMELETDSPVSKREDSSFKTDNHQFQNSDSPVSPVKPMFESTSGLMTSGLKQSSLESHAAAQRVHHQDPSSKIQETETQAAKQLESVPPVSFAKLADSSPVSPPKLDPGASNAEPNLSELFNQQASRILAEVTTK